MDWKKITSQMKDVEKMTSGIKEQSRIFENILQETVKGCDDSQKPIIEETIALTKRALALAKQGKRDEATQLIKDFKYGGQSN